MSATPTTSTPAAVPPQLRVVPGAPPPAPLSKTQKKKRKVKVAGVGGDESEVPTPVLEKVQLPAEDKVAPEKAQEKVPAPESIAPADSTAAAALDDDLIKLSPIVDLIHKRMKATTKKIVRFPLALLRVTLI